MTEFLRSHKVIICAGTGGVGKTTLSASLGVLAAGQGLTTLVLTIDPAHRLAQALGLEKQPGVDVAVPDVHGLFASMIEPRREFDEFVLGSVNNGIAKGLFNNRLYQQLVSNLNGSQEFTSLVRLLNSVDSQKYDLVILDTPPTQNAVDFLRAPERLVRLFQDTVIGWFSDPAQDETWMKRTLHRGTRLVTVALESVTGSTFIGELKDFFGHISHLREKIAQISRQVEDLLRSPTTGFILVTGFDETKLKEAVEFQGDLHREQLRLRAIIVNRWFPEWASNSAQMKSDGPQAESWMRNPDFQILKTHYEEFAEVFRERQSACEYLEAELGKSVPIVKLPDFKNTVQGIGELKHVAQVLTEKWRIQNEIP